MESLNNISTAVTKAIWGTDETTTQEPVSGKTGDVSKGQPYDAGNLEPSEQSLAQTPQPTTTKPKFESKPDTIPQTSVSPDKPTPSAAPPDNHSPAIPGPPDNHSPALPGPHKTLPSSSPPGDHTTSQSDTRDPSNPSASHHASAPKHNVDDTDTLLSGPGPRPLSVVAREHGGDAGRRTPLPPPKQEVGVPLERHDSGHESDKGSGGDKYIRSSGLVADGGDFDASKPGAGREADRLLEEKGLHRDGAAAHGGLAPNKDKGDAVDRLNASGMAETVPGEGGKEKVSLKTKIKNKLHRGSHSGEAGVGTTSV